MDPSVKIRQAVPADAQAIARVQVETWRTTYRGIVPDAFLDALSVPEKADRWRGTLTEDADKGFTFVAEEAGGPVAFAAGGRARGGECDYTGELYAIYVLKAQQGKGIGRCLARAVVSRLIRSGHASMLVWVLRDNPSRAFYESLGGLAVRARTREYGGRPLLEVGYGWTDLSEVAKCAEKA